MNFLKSTLLFWVCIISIPGWNSSFGSAHGSSWEYSGENGQNHWTQVSKACAGRAQSPIDIETKRVNVDESLEISLTGYSQEIDGSKLELENNGHTAQLNYKPEDEDDENGIPTIAGSALGNDKYRFVQLHFHWHMDDTKGSEHAIDGKRYALEMHYVHYNTKYGGMAKAVEEKDGLAVLATLFQVVRKNNSYLDPLVNGLSSVHESGMNTRLKNHKIILDELLPNNLDHFFKYSGSLTTPPCSESVTWILFSEVTGISSKQLAVFRNLVKLDEVSHKMIPMEYNVRDLQKIRKREVFASSFSSGSLGINCDCHFTTCFSLVISLLIAFILRKNLI